MVEVAKAMMQSVEMSLPSVMWRMTLTPHVNIVISLQMVHANQDALVIQTARVIWSVMKTISVSHHVTLHVKTGRLVRMASALLSASQMSTVTATSTATPLWGSANWGAGMTLAALPQAAAPVSAMSVMTLSVVWMRTVRLINTALGNKSVRSDAAMLLTVPCPVALVMTMCAMTLIVVLTVIATGWLAAIAILMGHVWILNAASMMTAQLINTALGTKFARLDVATPLTVPCPAVPVMTMCAMTLLVALTVIATVWRAALAILMGHVWTLNAVSMMTAHLTNTVLGTKFARSDAVMLLTVPCPVAPVMTMCAMTLIVVLIVIATGWLAALAILTGHVWTLNAVLMTTAHLNNTVLGTKFARLDAAMLLTVPCPVAPVITMCAMTQSAVLMLTVRISATMGNVMENAMRVQTALMEATASSVMSPPMETVTGVMLTTISANQGVMLLQTVLEITPPVTPAPTLVGALTTLTVMVLLGSVMWRMTLTPPVLTVT
jgi:hypothetical protein